MTHSALSVSLPARFLSAGQGDIPARKAEAAGGDALLLDVRESASSGADADSSRQAFLLPSGASLPGVSGEGARRYWVLFRGAESAGGVQVRLGPMPVSLSETNYNRFACGFHQLLWESAGVSGPSALCDYMLSALLLSLQDGVRRAPGNAAAARLLAYIRLHCCERLTLPDVAGALGYSEDYLSRLLHEQVSCSFREYIHRLRMQRAKKEILSGFRPIREIAEDCGYTNAKFFSTAFLKYEGMTPSAFRNLYASPGRPEDAGA